MKSRTKKTLSFATVVMFTLPVQANAQPTDITTEINKHVATARQQAEQALVDIVGNDGVGITIDTTTVSNGDQSVTAPVALPNEVHNVVNANTHITGVSSKTGTETYGFYPITPGNDRVLNTSLPQGAEQNVSSGRNGVSYKAGGAGEGTVVGAINSKTEYNPVPPPQPPTPKPAPSSTVNMGGAFVALAQCESGGNPHINTNNGYYGLYQFSKPTWDAVGGGEFAPYPHQATAEQQTIAAQRLVSRAGFASQFPACSAKLGLR